MKSQQAKTALASVGDNVSRFLEENFKRTRIGQFILPWELPLDIGRRLNERKAATLEAIWQFGPRIQERSNKDIEYQYQIHMKIKMDPVQLSETEKVKLDHVMLMKLLSFIIYFRIFFKKEMAKIILMDKVVM